ncbi:winged helix-turn-helix domain-containing protein [Chryseobacterium sp. RR2-3-20]|uniref:winged helix-turn-helix domain-containing protein n=1 Tax=Chryseobacterium sp. RR2-3-20 TaxID=2787626 RepID=UPI0021D436E5|nr:winged helix-turn-helix domain-containing protein [Chryseobacterium sp. RR2-3-20]
MTEKESELLFLLSQNNQKIISRKEILEALWGENDYFLGRSLDVFMTRLRKYFLHDDRIRFESVRGIVFRVNFPE